MKLTYNPLTGIHTAEYGRHLAQALSAGEAGRLCMESYMAARPALYLVG